MINLEEHKIFVESLNMEVVPYSIAIQALEELANNSNMEYENQLDEAIQELQNSINNLNLND
jgi:hypothetical protein